METEPQTKKCPFCAEEILMEAIKCKHCGSMIDGSAPQQKVTVAGVDPFAEYHTEIQGKKRGKLTGIGCLGIGLGALMLVMAVMAFPNSMDSGEGVFIMGLIGVGVIIASYLWARN